MLTAGGLPNELRLPNTLNLTPNHTIAVVGHLLRKLYTEEPENEQGYPDRLKSLIERLGAREQSPLGQEQG